MGNFRKFLSSGSPILRSEPVGVENGNVNKDNENKISKFASRK